MSESSLLDRFRQLSSRGRAAGSAEATARVQIAGYWYRAPLYARLLVVAGVVALGAFFGALAGYSPVTSGMVTLGILFAAGAFLLTPQLTATIIVVLLTSPLFIPLGTIYTLRSAPPTGDTVGGAIALSVAYAVGIWVAARWSRGRVWVTAAFMTAALLFLAPMLVVIFPDLGLNAARISLAVVLLLRCGGVAWIVGVIGLAVSRVRNHSHLDDAEGYAGADPEDVSSTWKRRAAVEKETAQMLSGLPREFRVFHDVLPPRGSERIGHLVIGPSGVIVVASVHAIGPLQEATAMGLQIPGVDLDTVIGGLLANKPLVARALKVHPRDVSLMVVVQSKEIVMDKRMRVAVHNASAPGKAADTISLVPAAELFDEIVTPFVIWSGAKSQQTIRRAQMKMRPSVLPVIRATSEDAGKRFSVSKVDQDGNLIDLADGRSSYEPGVLSVGSRVDVITTLGPMKGLRLVNGPVISKNGERVIYVCSEEEYLDGSLTGVKPKGHPFPVGSVRLSEVGAN